MKQVLKKTLFIIHNKYYFALERHLKLFKIQINDTEMQPIK